MGSRYQIHQMDQSLTVTSVILFTLHFFKINTCTNCCIACLMCIVLKLLSTASFFSVLPAMFPSQWAIFTIVGGNDHTT